MIVRLIGSVSGGNIRVSVGNDFSVGKPVRMPKEDIVELNQQHQRT